MSEVQQEERILKITEIRLTSFISCSSAKGSASIWLPSVLPQNRMKPSVQAHLRISIRRSSKIIPDTDFEDIVAGNLFKSDCGRNPLTWSSNYPQRYTTQSSHNPQGASARVYIS